MTAKKNALDELTHIRSLMESSVRYYALSGAVGVLLGIYALLAAFLAYRLGFNPQSVSENYRHLTSELAMLCIALVALSVITIVLATRMRASNLQTAFFTPAAKRLLVQLSITLLAGAVVVCIMFVHNLAGFVLPLSLLFYGLALLAAARFSHPQLGVLAGAFLLLGMAGLFLPQWGLALWATGFGAFHLAYGLFMRFALRA